MEEITNKLNDLLSTEEGKEKIKNILEMFASTNDEEETQSQSAQSNSGNFDEILNMVKKSAGSSSAGFNLNNTQMLSKIGSLLSMMDTDNDHRVNLLLSLRPFLSDARGSKIDHAVKMLQVSKISSLVKNKGG